MVKLFIGILFSQENILQDVLKLLKKEFGNIDTQSPVIPFIYTDYYNSEMGENLKRIFISFEKLISPDKIADIKIKTNKIEKKFLHKGTQNRQINLDPGYLTAANIILATTKDFSHRIYLKNGIYAEVTLMYSKKHFQELPWTYPDFKTEEYQNYFKDLRKIYMESFSTPELQNSRTEKKTYSKIKHFFMIFDIFFSLALLLGFLYFGLTHICRDWSYALTNNFYLGILYYLVIAGLFFYFINLPLDFISGFYVEHRFGLSNETLFMWIKNNIKKSLISFVIVVPLILAMYFLLKNFALTWWIWISIVWILASIILGKIAPVIIIPLFYKYKDIENEELKTRIFNLAKKTGIKIRDIYEINFSKETKKANAALTGLGKTRRIILTDNLLEKFTIDEIESVIAHEMGHHYYNHIIKLLFFGSIITFIGFFICSIVYTNFMAYFKFNNISDIAGLPLFGLIFFIISLIIMPAQNIFSRMMERQADKFSLIHTKNKEAFISAMKRLADINLADEDPNKVIEFLFYSHPSISKRVEAARRFRRIKHADDADDADLRGF
mgnify:CR=1 FL=1